MDSKKRFRVRHLILIFFMIYVIYTLVVQQIKMMDLARQEAELRQQIEAAVQQREQLKKQIQLLHTDSYIEMVARDKLGLVKPDEYIYKESKPSP
ncbi:MAG: septum formation initiator family protein [Tepidanaerobacteraceae bacterium]|nr:septum formation initiator family protein [Tepidanaerobacteraceae bacterium]